MPMDLPIGTRTEFVHDLTQEDIAAFAQLSGDFHPNHVDEEYMAETPYGSTIAHGILVMAYMTGASSKLLEETGLTHPQAGTTVVSYGYEHVRFVRPAFPGDTLTVGYEIAEAPAPDRRVAKVTVRNQSDDVIAVADHVMKLVGEPPPAAA